MSLDANLFTLNFLQSKEDPNIIDLVDPSDNPYYRKHRVPGLEYKINIYEPLSDSLLASVTAPSATSKVKVIELHNPSRVVELKYTGTLTFKWRFEWEAHEFEWRREECYIIRKPDPAVLVAVTREPSGRIRTSSVQILDYNLNRFDIDDRKGLEILILTALLTFQDTNEAYHTPQVPQASQSSQAAASDTGATRPGFLGITRRVSGGVSVNSLPSAAPALPPKPAPKSGADRIAEIHAMQAARGEGEANEVLVGEEGSSEEYAEYAERLLGDDAMLFVTIKSTSAAEVPKVLQVVEHTKRLRHKAGLDENQELFQYVIYDTARKGPRVINLDDNGPNHANYAPPTSLSVHLSKIDMPELRPRLENLRAVPTLRARPSVVESPISIAPEDQGKQKTKANEKDKAKERDKALRKAEKEAQKKAEKEAKEAKKAGKSQKSHPEPPRPNNLTKPALLHPSSVTPPSSQSNMTNQRSRPLSFHAPPTQRPQLYQPPAAMPSPAFPQVQSNHSFYGGMAYPSDPSVAHTLRPPPAPPRHPSTRPQSFYDVDSVPHGGYLPGYPRP